MKEKSRKKHLRRAHIYWGMVFLCAAIICGYLIWQKIIIDDKTEAAGTTAVQLSIIGQCADGVDNDKNGKIDYPADPGCSAATDYTEGEKPNSASTASASASTGLSISSTIIEAIKKLIGVKDEAETNVKDENNLSEPVNLAEKSDINDDGKINLTDFSVMAYWFKKADPPANVDINNDGKVNLTDLSILAFYWSG